MTTYKKNLTKTFEFAICPEGLEFIKKRSQELKISISAFIRKLIKKDWEEYEKQTRQNI